ncbi:MAG: cation-translocating P-type ATPase [Proteobacteria bacterium]|nr:cation-translocating P-type ATPase [Pseudomonadota bacterium]
MEQVQINYATRRAWVRWDDSRIKLSKILLAIRTIGYRAYPYNPDQHQALRQFERRTQLRRLAIAGLLGMQVMMMSISLYVGAWSGMERDFETLFRWLSLGLTTPVVFYSAVPFFRSAWNNLKNWQVGMDVPVSVSIGIAFCASIVATVNGKGHVYFDSVVMFVFFLLVTRYFESMARQRNAESVEKLAHALPMIATRLLKGVQAEEAIAVSEFDVGDRVLVRPGETIPADGVVLTGASCVDESLISGESHPVSKKAGDRLIGGSINHQDPLEMKVQSLGANTVLSAIQQMIERAQSDKPPLAQLADRIAARFIVAVVKACASLPD